MSPLPAYRFCPLCGGSLTKHSDTLFVCSSCGYRFYQNSKPASGALILRERREREILLVKRNVEPYRGMWDVPGGFIENGEDPLDALHREIKEELDSELTEAVLFDAEGDTYPRDKVPPEASNTLCLYYICSLKENEEGMQALDDISDFRWFPLDALPQEIAFTGNREALRKLVSRFTEAG